MTTEIIKLVPVPDMSQFTAVANTSGLLDEEVYELLATNSIGLQYRGGITIYTPKGSLDKAKVAISSCSRPQMRALRSDIIAALDQWVRKAGAGTSSTGEDDSAVLDMGLLYAIETMTASPDHAGTA